MPEIKYNVVIESKQGKGKVPAAHVFMMMSDFNNIKKGLPPEQKNSFYCTKDTCLLPIGRFKPIPVRIVSKQMNKVIKYGNDGGKIKFNVWLEMKQVKPNQTNIKMTVKAKLNIFLRLLVKKQLQKFVDGFVDSLCQAPAVQQRRH